MSRTGGFTVAELVVVIAIIGILTTLAVSVPLYFQKSSRDQERADDTGSLARRLEQAYNAQEVGSPSYPTTTKLTSDISNGTGTMLRLPPEAWKAPRMSASSVVMATSASTTAPAGAGTPTVNQYIYQPLNKFVGICTGTDTCVRFNLYYRKEATNAIVVIKSIHQQ